MPLDNCIQVDESWFYVSPEKQKVCIFPDEDVREAPGVQYKSHVSKAIFILANARPDPSRTFDDLARVHHEDGAANVDEPQVGGGVRVRLDHRRGVVWHVVHRGAATGDHVWKALKEWSDDIIESQEVSLDVRCFFNFGSKKKKKTMKKRPVLSHFLINLLSVVRRTHRVDMPYLHQTS